MPKIDSRSKARAILEWSRVCLGIVIATLLGAAPGFAGHGPKIKRPVRFAISPPLRSLKPIPPPKKIHLMPEHELPPGLNMPPAGGFEAPTKLAPNTYQSSQGTQQLAPATTVNFLGVGTGLGSFSPNSVPPDTNGDVGLNYYIQWVNTSFAIFNKSDGSLKYGPAAGNTLWQGLGAGNECYDDNDGDPIVQYDQMASRWIMTQFAVSQTDGSFYHQCIAVSQTSDPTGSWYLYDYSFSDFNDYPKMGVWPDGYYITYNMFSGNTFAGGEICAYDRSAMIAGNATASSQCFGPYSSYGGLLPADMDGPDPPPSGSSEYVIAKGGNGASLLFWKLHIDWTTPANSTFTGPTTLNVASFSEACNGGTCIPEPSPGNQVDSLADRLMYRFAYRNFPGDHESLLVNHSITGATASSAIRWYEIRDPGGTPTLYQSGTYDPDGTSRWMGSIAMDHMGNIALGYSASSSSVYPSIWYTGRLAGDSLGTMTQAESSIFNGPGVETSASWCANCSRWGDYSSMSIDPSDDCTFWYTQEYYAASTGPADWATRIAAFKYPDCTVCSTPAPTGLTATVPGDNAISLSWNAVSGATEYRVYRSTTSGGPYTQIATVTTASDLDSAVDGGVTYYYVVTAYDTCESPNSSEASATATGPCELAPTFTGISSATANGCAIDLAWSAATANCGGPVSYSVYRSTASGFTPALSNRIAAGLSGTTYTDGNGIAVGTTYYYKVRATDESNGQEDSNTAEASAATSASGTTTPVNEAFASGDPPTGWSLVNGGTGTQRWTTTNPGSRTPPAGITDPFEIIDSDWDGYGNTQDDSLITPAFSAAGATAVTLELDTYYRDYDNNDYAYIDVSSNGGATWTNVATWTANVGSSSTASHQTLDITTQAAGSANVKVRFHYIGTWGWYWFVDNVKITVTATACSSTPSDVTYLTARSTSGTVKLEWVNPSGTYGSTRICRDTAGYPTDPTACATVVADQAGTAGAYDSLTDSGLSNGTKYYYTAFVNDGSGNFSGGKNVSAYPFATTGKVKWAYSTGATSLAPSGVWPGAIGVGGTWAVSNDRVLHGMNPTGSGGDWPRTSPYSWEPMAMNAPADSRPPIVSTTLISGASKVVFLGSEDGHVYAANAETGATLWQSPQLANILVASPSAMFTAYGGAQDLVFVGSRTATADNAMYALNTADGTLAFSFNNGGGAGGIGIINSAATVDYANTRIYFASRARSGGSSDTLWCLSFNGTSFAKVWSAALGDIDSAPMVLNGRLYVGNNSGTIYAIDAASGATIWSYATSDGPVKGYVMPEYTTGTPTTGAPRKLYFSTTTTVWAINDIGSSATSGWSVTSIAGPSLPLAPYRDTHLYVGSTDGRLYQLDTSGTVTTSVMLGDGSATVGSPALDVTDSVAYVGSESGAVYAIQLPLQ